LNIYDLFSFDNIILQKEVLDNIGKYFTKLEVVN